MVANTQKFYPVMLDTEMLYTYHSPVGVYIAGKMYIASVVWWLGEVNGPFVQDVVEGDCCFVNYAFLAERKG